MPKGITQEQVNKVADALVAAGENPTVEKIRAQLGTGSPNTVVRMLDAWRSTLAQRMHDVLTLPEVPSEIGQAFVGLWRLALTHANTMATEALAHEQNALFAAQTSLAQERKVWEIALSEAQSNIVDCTARLANVDVQLTERQALVDQLEAQRLDLLQQRDRLQYQLEQERSELDGLRAERSAAQEHVRVVEDRAHQEVDHARQETRALQQRLEREQREYGKHAAQLTAQQEKLRNTLRTTEQAAAHQAGRLVALEIALKQSRSTPQRLPKRSTAKKVVSRKKK